MYILLWFWVLSLHRPVTDRFHLFSVHSWLFCVFHLWWFIVSMFKNLIVSLVFSRPWSKPWFLCFCVHSMCVVFCVLSTSCFRHLSVFASCNYLYASIISACLCYDPLLQTMTMIFDLTAIKYMLNLHTCILPHLTTHYRYNLIY